MPQAGMHFTPCLPDVMEALKFQYWDTGATVTKNPGDEAFCCRKLWQ